jgi:hypothetical protein
MKYFTLITLLVLSSCSHKNFVFTTDNQVKDKIIFEKVDINDLIKNPNQFHGKYIETYGYFTVNRNETALYLRKGALGKGIWLSFDEEIKNSKGVYLLKDNNIDYYNDIMLKIKGVFNKNKKGNLGIYGGTITNINFFSNKKE